MYLSAGGNVGIGTTNPGQPLEVVGTIRQSTVKSCTTGVQTNASGDFSACVASDQSLKTNVIDLTSAEIVDSLHPVYYNWIDTTTRDAQTHAGLIAQEVQKIIPEAVVPAGVNLLGIDSNALIAVLIKEIQAMRVRLANLEAK